MTKPKYVAVQYDDFISHTNRQLATSPPCTLLERIKSIQCALLSLSPIDQLACVNTLIADIERSSYLGDLVVYPKENFRTPVKIPLADCQHAACKWVGPMQDAVYNGLSGPFCPKCGNHTLKLQEFTSKDEN